MPTDRLGHSTHWGADQHRYLEGHRVVGNVHFVVLDGQLDFRSHNVRVLIDGGLVDWGVILFLLLLSLLFFLGAIPLPKYNDYKSQT